MTTQYFHSQVNDIIPFQATYTWPSQSTKIRKQTVKLVPKNGTEFLPSSKIEIEFPSDGYLNTQNSRLVFDFEVIADRPLEEAVDVKAPTDNTDKAKGATVVLTGRTAGQRADNYYAGYVLVLSTQVDGISLTDAPTTRAFRVMESFAASGATEACLKLVELTGDGQEVPVFKSLTLTNDAQTNITVIGHLYTGIHFGAAGVQELFSQEEVIYGGTQLEDIRHRQLLVRGLQSVATNEGFCQSVGAITEGRHATYIKNFQQGQGTGVMSQMMPAKLINIVNMGKGKYRYSVSMVSGLFNCNKLIPLKWLAAQWMLRLHLATPRDALITSRALRDSELSFKLSNVHYIAELIQFPETYDTAFYVGLNNGGVPIKFTTWRHHHHNITGQMNHMQISERARSIKSALAWVTDQTRGQSVDRWRSYYDLALVPSFPTYSGAHIAGSRDVDGVKYTRSGNVASTVTQYQYRIGGSYYPAQPVDCTNGAVEAYNELVKTLDGMNDFTYQHGIRPEEWSTRFESLKFASGDKFCMALQFENSDVLPDTITGISGEEQSDLALQVQLSNPPPSGKTLSVFLCVDSMIIVEAGNTVKLIM